MDYLREIKDKLQGYRIIIVSNREPYSHHYIKNSSEKKAEIKVKQNPGGLVSALDPIMKQIKNSLWVAWGSGNADFNVTSNDKVRVPDNKGYVLKRIKLTSKEVNNYYNGFSNNILWPNFHLFSEKCVFKEENWQGYKTVNQKFASEVLEEIKENDLIWIHDYQLLLVPKYIKEKKPNAKIAFFCHIPFPPYEIFSHLCTHWNKELLRGMLSADMIGFQTENDAYNFIRTTEKILGAKRENNGVSFNKKFIKVKSFPIGIDYEEFNIHLSDDEIKKKVQRLNLKDKIIIFGVDRLDYTKGILERLWAFKDFLEKNENLRNKVVFIQITSPSRTKVKEYEELRKKIDGVVGEINSKFRDLNTGLEPVRHYYKSFTQKELIFYYNIADIALIIPLADGMNLVAKEFVAANNKGVLILSNRAGASKQLKEAIIVNPRDIPEIANAIGNAIDMPDKEKIKRLKKLKKTVKEKDIWWWIDNFFSEWIKSYK